MLSRVMIDFRGIESLKSDLDKFEYFLLPYLYLFADQVYEPVVCKGNEIPEVELPPFIKPVYIFNDNPPFVCDYAITAYKTGNKEYMGSYFSPSQELKKKTISVQGVTAYNSVLLLAAAGLKIQLPGYDFDTTRTEEIEEIRHKLAPERKAYVDAINRMADESYERLRSSDYLDTINWAMDQSILKIMPRVNEFNKAIKDLDKKLLTRIGISFFNEGIPSIGSSLLENGIKDGGKAFIAAVLKSLCTNLFLKIEQRRYPEVVYGYRLGKYRTSNSTGLANAHR